MPHVEVDGIKVHYESTGEGDAALLIVGLGGNHLFWNPLLPAMSKNHRVITFDWPGTGLSEDRADERVTTRDVAKDVAGLMTALDIDAAHVVGRSMGGAIAQYLAIDHPEMVRSLVLASTWGRADAHLARTLRSWVALVQAGYDVLIDQAIVWGFPRFLFEEEYAGILQEVTDVTDEGITLGQDPESFRRLANAGANHDALGELHQIVAPCRVMFGSEDILTPLHLARELYRLIPTAELVEFEGSGHAFYEQYPAKFADSVVDLWSKA